MTLEMTCLEIICLKADLQTAVHTLQHLGCVQIDDLNEVPEISTRRLRMDAESLQNQEKLNLLATQLDGLLDTLGIDQIATLVPYTENILAETSIGLNELVPKVQALISRRDELQAELASLPLYEATLEKLEHIIPPSALEVGNMSVGILVNRAHMDVLELVQARALDLTGGRAEVVTSNVDDSTHALLIVFPKEFADEIDSLLEREDVSRLRPPSGFGEGLPNEILEALRRRLASIPEEIEAIDRDLANLADQWRERLVSWRTIVSDELEVYSVLSRFGETDQTVVVLGWAPAQDVKKVRNALEDQIGDAVLVHQIPLTTAMKKRAPVALQNPPPAKPFETLVKLLSIPRYGSIDPTRLMALFMPIFFGMMLGDIGYGVILLGLCLVMLRKIKGGAMGDLVKVLAMGSGWSIVFGFLFGEAFGNLGEHLGLHPIWFDRASAEYVIPLFMTTLAVGAAHQVVGLILGVLEAVREKSRSHLLERGGMLLGLVALFMLVGVLVDFLPAGMMTPAVGGLIVGIVLLGSASGIMGVLLGPIEFLGLIGNVLSYLRIAAIGLASVYLAQVANDLAGLLGNLVVGVIVAVLIHALNVVMGAFSPTIHSLRLHYVEFFRKFYEGGGRAYEPFRSHILSDN
ncbi:MAG: V-type ATP synthase subunit I [Anaerolineales bacterium]|nr:MAG: V-type ATP synthase subunit I [Anaerolineales bacterium]